MTIRLPNHPHFKPERPVLMGILNVTRDSFSDGGVYTSADQATQHGLEMVADGADIIDVGGESTRPGAARTTADQQKQRVLGVIGRLRAELPPSVPISIDTTRSEVAVAAVKAGASMLNDISAGREDPAMFDLAAQTGLPLVLMHLLGTPATMQDDPHYDDVVAEVEAFLVERADAAQAAGVTREQIILDPGIGFGKTRPHNLALVAHLDHFVATGYPILLGASRKRFMGSICRETVPRNLIGATCATTALGVLAGVSIFRVHDIRPNRQAADVAWALASSG